MDQTYHTLGGGKEHTIRLDFTNCSYISEIHGILKESFGLPDYYGENRDALWDCLDGLFEDQILVSVIGFSSMKQDLQNACKPLLDLLDQLQRENASFCYRLLS